MRTDAALYVYGVVHKRRVPAHLARRGVKLVSSGRVAALVTAVPDEPTRATRRALLGHAEIVEDAFEWTTILPMRFGVVFPDEAATRAAVLDRAETDDVVGKLRVSAVLQALPGIGKIRATQIMEKLKIADSRRLRGLGDQQRKALLGEFAAGK